MLMNESVGNKIKREVVRAILERSQTVSLDVLMNSIRTGPAPEFDDVEETLNIPYINRGEVPLAMDVFKPKVPAGTELPVIIMVHGGGLTMGDRGLSRPYCRVLAHKKYLVFSLEYRLAPKANVCQQLDDVCAGMDLVGRMIVDYGADPTRIYLTADSAGAYLAIYVAAMSDSDRLEAAIGYKATHMRFSALGLMSGMFYTNQKDPTGWMLSDQIYGDKNADEVFLRYMDPENPEIIDNLPPVFLITTRGDLMNNYTFMFHEALQKAQKTTRLLYYADEDLMHAFMTIDPMHPKSLEATDKMLAWFEEQTALRLKKNSEVDKRRRKVEKRLEDGTIANQKAWSYIKERISVDENASDRTAIIDCTREYTFSQMFAEWERYAKVFSGLDITSKNKSRVALAGAITAEVLFAFYGLNMTGAEVSMFSYPDFLPTGKWKAMMEKEKITDLILQDIMVTPQLFKDLEEAKEELGLRNVIFLHSRLGGPTVGPAELVFDEVNYQVLKRAEGTVFMDDLFREYTETPVSLDKSRGTRLAVITHTSGTTKGTRKPLPYTDNAFITPSVKLPHAMNTFAVPPNNKKHLRQIVHFDFSSSFALNMVNAALAAGNSVVLTFFGFMHPKFIRAIEYYNVNTLVAAPFMVDSWMERTDLDDVSFASLKVVGLGGSYVPPEKMKQYTAFFKEHGFRYDIIGGYGMSESGGEEVKFRATEENADKDTLGIPENPESFRIRDEADGQYYRISDGPRTGIMYIASSSKSGNTLDGETLFEYTQIEGQDYVCTNDLVRVDEDGSLSYAGRTDQYFVNNEGKRFDSGLVDKEMSAHPAVFQCAVVPVLEKRIHDTVPVFYVVPAEKGADTPETIRRAFVDVYVKEKKLNASQLPVQFVIVDSIPCNARGKIDIYQITRDRLKGDAYNLIPIKEDDELTDITVEHQEHTDSMVAGTLPEGMGKSSSFNLFDLLNSAQKKEPKKEEEQGMQTPFGMFPWMQMFPGMPGMQMPFGGMPFGGMPFGKTPFGGMPFGKTPFGEMPSDRKDAADKDDAKLQTISPELLKLGNKLMGFLYSSRAIDFDIEE